MTITFTEAYDHAAAEARRQIPAQRDLTNYLASNWIAQPHAKQVWQRGMGAGFVAVAYGVDLSTGD